MKDLINIDQLIKYLDIDFLIKLISLHYAFTESEINEYFDILEIGDAHYSVFISDEDAVYSPKFGLCFNNNINWTRELKAKWSPGLLNPYIGIIEGTGTSPVEIGDSKILNNIMPLSVIQEIRTRNECILNHWQSVLSSEEDWENPENFIGPNLINEEKYLLEFPSLSMDELAQLYIENKSIILFNESIWQKNFYPILDSKNVSELISLKRSINL
jgi:hypothetical protein